MAYLPPAGYAMHPLIEPVRATVNLNNALFSNVLEGLDDAAGRRRVGQSSRRVDHIAAHLLDARGSLATLMGIAVRHALVTVLAEATSFDALGDRASLSAVRTAWTALNPVIVRGFETLDPVRLAEPSPHAFPIGDPSVLGAITFLLQHESYHIGQLGLLRRELGYPALRYPEVGG